MTVQVAIEEKKDLGAMPHRGMASLASVGLDEKPWLSASLAWLTPLPASVLPEKAKG